MSHPSARQLEPWRPDVSRILGNMRCAKFFCAYIAEVIREALSDGGKTSDAYELTDAGRRAVAYFHQAGWTYGGS